MVKIDKTPVHFRDLKNYNDSTTAVFMAVTYPESQDWDEVNDFFSKELEFSKGKTLIGAHYILDNVLGNKGRSDYLLEFDHPEIPFNPIARLRAGSDLKWTSDFITNFRSDYNG